jgi:hypothetical protein
MWFICAGVNKGYSLADSTIIIWILPANSIWDKRIEVLGSTFCKGFYNACGASEIEHGSGMFISRSL